MRSWKFLLPLLASTLCFAAQPDRITGTIDSGQMVVLPGRIHRMALPQYDQGPLDGSYQFTYVTMLFTPSAAQTEALDLLLAQQQDPASANYHKWLTPEQFADRFGLPAGDMKKVTDWLKSQGLQIVTIARGRQFVVFGGTAAQVESAFRTEFHHYNVNGEMHFANAIVPSIPAALSGIVGGFRGMDDFRLKPSLKRHPDYTLTGAPSHFIAPGDLYTIYDITSLQSAGIDGTGQKIAIIGQTDLILTDINDYRTDFGLPAINLVQTLVPGTGDPGVGVSGDLGESDLDLQVSGAIAPNATINFVYAGFTGGGEGVTSAAQYAIDNVVAPVISFSYGQCEFYNAGPSPPTLPTQDLLYKQAASAGISFFAASGDDGPAICDINDTASEVPSALLGLAVSYPASSAYVTAVGGTEFNEGSGTYWNTGNTGNGGSAISYIPEKSWNDFPELHFLDGGGGGPSNCANQTSDFSECVSGFPKPSWQVATGVPTDGVRDVPDVSLSASNVNDPYIVCMPLEVLNYPNDSGDTTSSCASGIASALNQNSAFGGTSASTPLMAGITVLLNQYLNGTSTTGLGLINPMLYSLYATSPSAFHDTPAGSNSTVSCTVGDPVGQPAALVCQTGTFGFSTTAGYDLVTGLGSVDAHALAVAWAATRTTTSTSISPSATTVAQGASVTFTATITPSTATGTVYFYDNGSTALGSSAVSSGTAALATTALPSGSNNVVAIYNGDPSDNASTSATPAVVTVTASDFTLQTTSPLAPASISAGQSAIATLTLTLVQGTSETINFTNSAGSPTSFTPGSCTAGLPAGALCSFQNLTNPLTPTSVTLTTASPSALVQLTITTAANMALPTGAQTITVTGTPSGNGTTSHTANVSLTINATQESFTIAPTNGATFPVSAGGAASVNLAVSNGTNGIPSFINNSTSPATTALPLTYTCTQSSLPSEASCAFSPSGGNSVSATTVTLSISTAAPTGQMRPPLGRGSNIFYALLLPGLFGIVFAAGSRTRTARLLSLIVVLGFSTLWLGACGGSSNSSQKNPGTPAGTYSVIVNATTGGALPLTSQFTVTLTVTN